LIPGPCDASAAYGEQCPFTVNDCSTFPHPPCTVVVADPNFPGCCKALPKVCPSDLCNNGVCDSQTGQCSLVTNCSTSNPCFPGICGVNGCENPPKCQSGISGCTTTACNAGVCDSKNVTAGCVSDDLCFTSTCTDDASGQSCVVAPFCPTSTDICNPVSCSVENGAPVCKTKKKDCGAPASGCRDSGCDAAKGGCFAVPQDGVCQEFAPCLIGSCNVTDGVCSYAPFNCSDPVNFPPGVFNSSFCFPLECDRSVPSQPCQVRQNNCSQGYNFSNGSCDIIRCDNRTDKCVLDQGQCFPLAALIAGLAGGAIAGIVVAACVAAALVSGAAGAVAAVEKSPEETHMSNNPIYHDKGDKGHNPFHNSD